MVMRNLPRNTSIFIALQAALVSINEWLGIIAAAELTRGRKETEFLLAANVLMQCSWLQEL